jgi:replicative DNA helicase
MKRFDLMQRIICSRARVSSTRLRNGAVGKDEIKRLQMESMRLADDPLYIDDSEAPTIHELRARARREVRKHDIKCIMVDYLGLIRVAGATIKSRENEVGMVSRGFKAMAMELDIPVIAAAQLNRQVEGRTDSRPKLSDLTRQRQPGARRRHRDHPLPPRLLRERAARQRPPARRVEHGQAPRGQDRHAAHDLAS